MSQIKHCMYCNEVYTCIVAITLAYYIYMAVVHRRNVGNRFVPPIKGDDQDDCRMGAMRLVHVNSLSVWYVGVTAAGWVRPVVMVPTLLALDCHLS